VIHRGERQVFHRILVGVDDSPAGRRALDRAIELAADGNGRLGLLTSAPNPPLIIATSPIVPPASRCQLAEEMVDWAQECVDAATELVPAEIPVTKLVAHGDPAAALCREADSGCWDLIVVGQSARRFRLRAPLGERLGRHATPVLVVHDEPSHADGGRPAARLGRKSRRAAAPVAAKGV
jgi:nucleotide-binding universal stress UspA family protein